MLPTHSRSTLRAHEAPSGNAIIIFYAVRFLSLSVYFLKKCIVLIVAVQCR